MYGVDVRLEASGHDLHRFTSVFPCVVPRCVRTTPARRLVRSTWNYNIRKKTDESRGLFSPPWPPLRHLWASFFEIFSALLTLLATFFASLHLFLPKFHNFKTPKALKNKKINKKPKKTKVFHSFSRIPTFHHFSTFTHIFT